MLDQSAVVLQNLQFKMAAVYTLPWQQIKLSVNEQNLPSIPLLASYSYREHMQLSDCRRWRSLYVQWHQHGGSQDRVGHPAGGLQLRA